MDEFVEEWKRQNDAEGADCGPIFYDPDATDGGLTEAQRRRVQKIREDGGTPIFLPKLEETTDEGI